MLVSPEKEIAEKIKEVKASYRRASANENFLLDFYQRFISADTRVKEKFKNTSMDKQQKMLDDSLHILIDYASGHMDHAGKITSLGEKHNRHNHDITAGFYEIWLDCLMQSLEEFDPMFNTELEQKWRVALMPGIQLMVRQY